MYPHNLLPLRETIRVRGHIPSATLINHLPSHSSRYGIMRTTRSYPRT